MKKAVFTNSYNAKKAVAPVQKKAPDDKMKSPKTGNDSLMVIWTTMILAVLEKEKRFSLYKEKCNMKKISLLFCLIILQAGLLCGCRLPHKSSPQKPVEGENKSGLVKVQDDKKEEKKEEKEKGIDRKTGKVLVEVSPDFYRPTDVVNLWGDPSKARRELGWNPRKTSFEQLVKIMVDADMAKVAVERASAHVRTNLAEYLEKGIVK